MQVTYSEHFHGIFFFIDVCTLKMQVTYSYCN